jgi:uncharacterized membrane protein YoaK (UPF0700 family)
MSDAEYSKTQNSGSVFGTQQFTRKQERKAVALALVAGVVDAYGVITYHTYLSYMSGNTTQTGYKIGQRDFAAAVPSAIAIVFFVGGSFAGSFLAHSASRRPHRPIFGSVAALLALIIGFTQFGLLSDGVHIAVVSFAMGVMNLALTRVGKQRVNLTFVTGTLRSLGEHLALAVMHAPLADSQGSWDTHSRRSGLLALIWSGFLAGAILSGAATPHFGAWVLLLPIVMLSALAVLDGDAGETV